MEAPPATTTTAEDCCVKVAVHIRPLIGDEKLQACQDCVAVRTGKPPGKLSLTYTQCHLIVMNCSLGCKCNGFYTPKLRFQLIDDRF